MSFYPVRSGDWDVKWFRKKASTAITPNTFVTESSDDDTIEPCTSSSADVVGIAMKKVASTDSDYASLTRIPVLVPVTPAAEIFCNDVGGTFAVTDEGELIDLTDADTADADASTTDILKVKQFVSTTSGIFTLNKPSFV